MFQATTRAMRSAAQDASDARAAGDNGGGEGEEAEGAAARNFVFVLSDANFQRYGLDIHIHALAACDP